jgi:hypothetical protein
MSEGSRVHRPGQLPQFNPEEGPDANLVLDWTSGDLDWIDKTVGGITYRKTFTWSGGNLVAVSDWVKQP